jgi:hypothetical protein
VIPLSPNQPLSIVGPSSFLYIDRFSFLIFLIERLFFRQGFCIIDLKKTDSMRFSHMKRSNDLLMPMIVSLTSCSLNLPHGTMLTLFVYIEINAKQYTSHKLTGHHNIFTVPMSLEFVVLRPPSHVR